MTRDPYRFRAALRSTSAPKPGVVDIVLRVEHTEDVGRLLWRLGARFSVLMIESPEPAREEAEPEQLPV